MRKKIRSEQKKKLDPRKRRRLIAFGSLAVIFIALGVIYGIHWATVLRYQQSTDDAYVAGNRVAVMAQERGRVVTVLADNTMRVHRGQLLVRLDNNDARTAIIEAEARHADTVRQTAAREDTRRQLQARVATQRAGVELWRHAEPRSKGLRER